MASQFWWRRSFLVIWSSVAGLAQSPEGAQGKDLEVLETPPLKTLPNYRKFNVNHSQR